MVDTGWEEGIKSGGITGVEKNILFGHVCAQERTVTVTYF